MVVLKAHILMCQTVDIDTASCARSVVLLKRGNYLLVAARATWVNLP